MTEDLYVVRCPDINYVTPPLTLPDVARHLSIRDEECRRPHRIVPMEVTGGADAEWVADVMRVDLLS